MKKLLLIFSLVLVFMAGPASTMTADSVEIGKPGVSETTPNGDELPLSN
ncbi:MULTISPECIES: hypothetical protein [Halobacillus]|nr:MULTISPECIES: hypothetical protein [Halobacillus]